MYTYDSDGQRCQPTVPRSTARRINGFAWALLATILVVSAGCTSLSQWAHQRFKVGPDYCRPAASVSGAWIDHDDPSVISQSTDYRYWWAIFNDPALNQLEYNAARQNLSLRLAGMRILEARAILNQARGTLWPQQQQAYGEFNRTQFSKTTAVVYPSTLFDTWSTGFNASWELDIWGRFRRVIESAEANLDAEVEGYDDVLVILQGEVAAAYIQMRTLQERLEIARRNIKLQRHTLELADVRFRNGAVTELDVAQAKENLNATLSSIPRTEEAIRKTQNAICVLLGVPPRDLQLELGVGPTPRAPAEVVVGIPAQLLRRRPDVRKAERLAAAQSAQIGVAEAELYPQFAITGFIGLESEDFATLFKGNSWAGSIGPGFRWNVLNYGRIRNHVRAEEARFYQAVLNYQNTVLAANKEVEDGLVGFLKEKQRVVYLTETVTAAERSVTLADSQYREGAVDFQRVIDTQRTLVLRQDELADSHGKVSLNLVAIYKALGGGWATRLAPNRLPVAAPGLPVVPIEETEPVEGILVPGAPGLQLPTPQLPTPPGPPNNP